MPPAPRAAGAPNQTGQRGNGTIEISVRPGDADILVDGQPWHLADGQDRIVIDTSEGRHTVQVRKAGYIGYLTEVDVRPGETAPLNISLRTQP